MPKIKNKIIDTQETNKPPKEQTKQEVKENTQNTEKEPKQTPLFEFKYKPVEGLNEPINEPITEIKKKKTRMTKKKKQGLKAGTDFIINLTDLLFKKLNVPLAEDEKDMLSTLTTEALVYNFPNIENQVSPNITLILGFGGLLLPRLPSLVKKYKENKQRKLKVKPIIEQEQKPKIKQEIKQNKDPITDYLHDLQQAELQKQKTYKEVKKLEGVRND